LFLDDPGAIFFWRKAGTGIKAEETGPKKEREEGLWKLAPRMEIRKERGFPRDLKRASQTTLGFFTVPTGPAAGDQLKTCFRRRSPTKD
jgi:hypothetical protein